MKQITRMATLGVLLLAGATGTAMANGTSAPEPAPVRYMPPPPEPEPEIIPAPEAEKTGPYISGAVGLGIPTSFRTDYSHATRLCCRGRSEYQTCRQIEYIDKENGSSFDMDNGLVLNGAIGYDFGALRLEGALGYQRHDIADSDDDSHITFITLMANGYYDIETGSDFTPYLMAGAGVAHANMSWTDNDEDVFAWQVGAGIGYQVSENWTLDLGYRYINPNKFNTDELGDGELELHNIMLGLRYQF